MSTPNIETIIPEGKVRQAVYRIFAAVGFLLGATQVAFAAASLGQPTWLTVALAVYGFAAAAGFVKAQANTPTDGPAITGQAVNDTLAAEGITDNDGAVG